MVTKSYINRMLFYKHTNKEKTYFQGLSELSCETGIPIINLFKEVNPNIQKIIISEMERLIN